jgi:predicted porin
LAATSAFAQSAVTLTGNLDFAYGSAKAGSTSAEKTIATTNLTSSTSVIKITATEDLGGGSTATVQYGIDPRGTSNTGTTSPTRDETFIGLANANLGNLRVGAPNSIGLSTFGVSSPFGTGIGGGYGKNTLDFSSIRLDRSARYDSPAFGGVTLSAYRAERVGTVVNTTGVATPAPITAASATAGRTELGAAYTNGPLNLAFANIQQSAVAANAKTKHNLLSANYTFGATTVYGSVNTGDSIVQAASATQTKGNSLSIKHTMGQIDLLAGLNNQTASGAAKETVTGLRADYNFSKTTATYVGYEKFKAAASANDQKIMSIGVRKSF